MTAPWSLVVRLREIGAGVQKYQLEPDEAQRAAIARTLRLRSLPALNAEVSVRPWMDGVEITGRLKAVVGQTCSVSLDAFEQPLEGEIELRAVPASSPHVQPVEGGEIDYDPEAPDPPDVLDADAIDLAAYVVEHLALEIDPFPRKPGAVFDYQPPDEPESPFAALKALKDPRP
jgi:uncharacterized metal-binding protein YceD (DUF177 family)